MCGRALIVTMLALAASTLVGCGNPSEQTPNSGELPNFGPPAIASPSSSAPVAGGPVVGDKNFPMPAPVPASWGSVIDSPCPTLGARLVRSTAQSLRPTSQPQSASQTGEKADPPVEVDSRMKADSARSYELPLDYEGEYDHLVSRMLGGSSEDPRNRWPQPQAKLNPKDRIEIALHEGVCKGMISLSTAQRALAANWVTAADAAGLQLIGDPNEPVEESKACLRDNPSRCTTLHRAYDD
jgi:hypothetical protein